MYMETGGKSKENLTTITSSSGESKPVTVRRTDSWDADKITELISPDTEAVFGKVNVIYLLEKANLAFTISTATNEVLAHAAFMDHPIGDLVDQASWEQLLHTHFNATQYTPLNTIFLHLFVAQLDFSISSAKEIIRTVFNAITELEYICIVTPYSSSLEPALMDNFEHIPCVTNEVQCGVFVSSRHKYFPRLYVRKARVEDLLDLTYIEQMTTLSISWPETDTLAKIIEAEDKMNHVAVFEKDDHAIGFFIVSGTFDLPQLNTDFELGPFNGLKKAETQSADSVQSQQATDDISVPQKTNTECEVTESEPIRARTPESGEGGVAAEAEDNAFLIRIQIDKRFETRAMDCLLYAFQHFPRPHMRLFWEAIVHDFMPDLWIQNFRMNVSIFFELCSAIEPFVAPAASCPRQGKEREFCILLVHTLDPDSPLFHTFNRAVPRDCTQHELYIFRREGLLRTIKVRVAVPEDTPAIRTLVPQHKSLIKDLHLFFHLDPDVQAFVAQAEGQIIGVLVIKNEQDMTYIRANYDIEKFVYFSHHQLEEHGRLCHFALNPVFQHYAKHLFKEALRLAHKSCLYYRVYPSYITDKSVSAHSLTAVLSSMVPVHPRRQIIYPLKDLGINAPSTFITREEVPYALNHINRKLTMESKININARIVVVGASDTGLAFLEALVFCPHLQFNNLTLISPHGFPEHRSTENISFLSTSHCYTARDHAQLSFRSWVSVVKGKMTAIDRRAKFVQVNGHDYIHYDQLILCTGHQYEMVCPIEEQISTWSTSSVSEQQECRYTGHVPSNLFTLNNQQDCAQAYRWLRENFVKKRGIAVVYGDTIDVYTCVATLLRIGVSGSRIHVVHPCLAESPSCFQSPVIDQAVKMTLEKQNIHVHHDCLLAQINDGQHPEPLTSVSFATDGPPFRLECGVFFNFCQKRVDYDCFNALNSANVVFDGRLVIDSNYHTNDSSIHAAGPLTKLSRHYYADQWSHSYFNSKDVGQELAAMLLNLFDPTLEPKSSPSPEADRVPPSYMQPKIIGGKLPGGFHYLHVAKPSGYSDTYLSHTSSQGRSIVTGSVETGNYFQLQFSQHSIVESITCLSLDPFPVSNYLCLYGKHQLLLNHLYARFDEELIHNLYRYFRESWCMAVFHDRFSDFLKDARQLMTAELGVSSGQRKALANVKESFLEYLCFNQYHLPMYARPKQL